MSFISAGVSKWSQIQIDADKDMLGYSIVDLRQLAVGMSGGDLIAKGLGGVIVRIPAGIANTVLTSAGIGLVPTWAPGGLYLNRYFPVNINNSTAANIVAAIQQPKTVALSSTYKQTYTDDPADFIKKINAAITTTKSAAVKSIDASNAVTKVLHRFYDLQIVVGGAEAYNATGATYTEETAAAQNATANDMTLLPAVPATNCAYYFGFDKVFDVMTLNIGTPGNGVWTMVWEYWNGAWVALAGVTDGTMGFTNSAGNHDVTFTRPGDWATTAVNSVTKYWIRGRLSAYTSITTQPKGTQAWIKIITYN